MHKAYRVALGLDIWQLGLPVRLTLKLLDIEEGKIGAGWDWPEVERNLWDRFVEAVAERVASGQRPEQIRLNPWVPSQVWRAYAQLCEWDLEPPRHVARPRGFIPWAEFPPPRRVYKPYVRKYRRQEPDSED